MEYFGSKPGRPLDECLAAVDSCSVYIGLFAMRYGSIPAGHEYSMTHLEYLQAQKRELPSLIYLIDEANQPVLPRFVETGNGAEKLKTLKEHLRDRHVVSFFMTPQDLAAKILHDVPELLRRIGTKVEGEIEPPSTAELGDVLDRFEKLPKMFAGREIVARFKVGNFSAVHPDICEALNLTAGATVSYYAKLVEPEGQSHYIYAENEIAQQIVELAKGTEVEARLLTKFGTYREGVFNDGSLSESHGLAVQKILNTVTAKPAAG